jgi:sterol desaturase/sphingolipid hydroxylase (fatty acid hydroxylase superfamily)
MVLLITLCAAAVMIVVELRRPGRSWPQVRGWWARAALLNGFQAAIAWLGPASWDRWMSGRRPWTADALGTTAGALLGYLVITFVYYWWHRARHQVPFLWRWVHQVHHSPQRIEILTSFYKHPIEIVLNGLLSSAICYFVVGLGPAATTQAVLLSGLAELFYHWNVRTPYWLGFVFQRPESHCVHHQQGLHRGNYSDLPLWDWMFGTLDNPRHWDARCGFRPEHEARLGAMLAGRVMHE